MDTKADLNSLIDWNGPVAECVSKPLIPLPSFNSPEEVREDNPFDAVERLINDENEPFDVFSLNISSNSADNREAKDILIDKLSADVQKVQILSVFDKMMNVRDYSKETILKKRSSLLEERNEKSNEAETPSQVVSPFSTREVDDDSKRSSNSSAMNNGFFQLTRTVDDDNHARERLSRSETAAAFEEYLSIESVEDIRSIAPNWEESIFLSSSDDEMETASNNFANSVKKSSIVKSAKNTKMTNHLVESMRNLRVPLVPQDPNIRLKKGGTQWKQGPLKAVIPISGINKGPQKRSPTTPFKKACKFKKSVPVATSTPQTAVKNISFDSKNSWSIQSSRSSSPAISTIRPPSPDSTTGVRHQWKNNSSIKFSTKSDCKVKSSNAVTSSTNITFPRATSRLSTMESKNLNFSDRIPKGIGTKLKNVLNKENVLLLRRKR